MLNSTPFRYGLAFFGVAAAIGLRFALESWLGFSLPPFVTFYPMVTVVAILAGLGPGVLAIALSCLTADYWIFPPVGQFSIDLAIDQVRLATFIFLGLLVSLVAEFYRRKRSKAAIHEREVALKIHQEVLRASENRFQTMVNAMPQLGWIAGPDGYLNWYNERWYEYTGTTPEQMEGWGWQIVHDAVELPKVLDCWKESIAKGSPFEMNFPLRGVDGSFRMFLTRAFPLKDAAGNVVQWFGTNTDVEEQTRADKLLRESEARYRSLVEQAADGIFLADSQGRYIDVNEEGCMMLGYSRDEVLNLTLTDVLDPGEIAKLGSHLVRLAEGESVVNEWQFLRKDGSTFFGEVRSRQLKNGNLQGILTDITERRRIEQELIVMNNQLKHDVSNRTLELSALTGHIQRIAETERAKFARELHDEMGSIMTALSMEVGRLQGKASDPDLLHNLTVIRELISKAVKSKRNIINQLYPTVLDDYGLVHAVNLMVTDYRKHFGIEVEMVMPKEDIFMVPDHALAAYRITQECLNNIAKHSSASKVLIEATAKDGFLDLTISDNGKGMPSEIRADSHGIFGMIERARYFGGSMKIGSEEGAGTTAHLCLPLSAAKSKTKRRVLVADDHAIVRDALRQLLEREADDFSVEGEAEDGNAAVQKAISEDWDIMLLDISMPRKSGIKALEEIKALKPGLPIIILSSYPKEDYAKIVISKGAAEYIEKDSTDKLIEAMRRVVVSD